MLTLVLDEEIDDEGKTRVKTSLSRNKSVKLVEFDGNTKRVRVSFDSNGTGARDIITAIKDLGMSNQINRVSWAMIRYSAWLSALVGFDWLFGPGITAQLPPSDSSTSAASLARAREVCVCVCVRLTCTRPIRMRLVLSADG